mgnify:CR=1 FL=1
MKKIATTIKNFPLANPLLLLGSNFLTNTSSVLATANDVVTLSINDVEKVIPQYDPEKTQITFVLVQSAGTATMTNANVSVVSIK